MPHFTLGEARNAAPASSVCQPTRLDISFGSIDLGGLRHDQQKFHRYFDRATYTFGVAIAPHRIEFVHL